MTRKIIIVTTLLIIAAFFLGFWLGILRVKASLPAPYYFLTKRYVFDALHEEEKWTRYFTSPEMIDNISIVEFILKKEKDNNKFSLNKDDSEKLYKKLCSRLQLNHVNQKTQNGIYYYTDYTCIFSDGERVDCQSIFQISQEHIYLSLFYPGYPDNPYIDISLEDCLNDRTQKDLREWLLDN